jgi:hypothetical protein
MEDRQSQLDWERRLGRPAGIAAFLSVLFSVGSVIAQSQAFPQNPGSRSRVALRVIDGNSTAFLAASVFRALSYLTIGFLLWYLFRVTRHRRPELPSWLMPLIYFGPLVLAVATVLITFGQLHAASDFIAHGARTEQRADDLIKGISQVPQVGGLAGSFAFAVSLVLVSLNAMRVGLLTRFLGIIGVIIGALIVLPLVPGVREIVQIFWLGAIGSIVLGFWPGGRGRAWETGQPDVWPSAAEQRRASMRDQKAEDNPLDDPKLEEPDDRDAPVADAGEDQRPEHPTSKKRRKKRRR